MPSANRTLAVGAAANWAVFAAYLLSTFFLTPYLVRGLGGTLFGVWAVAEGVVAYFTLFDLGVAACLIRYVAKHHAAGEQAGLNKVVSAGMAVFLAAAGFVLVVGAGVVAWVGPGLERRAGGAADITPFMLLMLANVALTLPLSVFPSVLDGLQRFAAKGALRVAFLGLRVAGTVWVMETRPGLLWLGVVQVATNLLEHAVAGVLAVRALPGLRVGLGLVDRAALRTVGGYSRDAFLAMLAARVANQTGSVVVGWRVGVVAAGWFANAFRLVETGKNALRSATTALTPAASEREAVGDLGGVRRVFLAGTRWALYVVLPVHLGILFFGRPFLHRWLGPPGYPDDCYRAAVILSATLSIGVAQSVASRILFGVGRLRFFARLALAEAGLNLVLTLALVGPFGAEGVAVAVAGPNVLFCLGLIGYTARELGVPLGRYVRTAWLRPLAAAVVPAAVWWWITPAEATWIGIALGLTTGLVPYTIAVGLVEFGGRWRRAGGRLLTSPLVGEVLEVRSTSAGGGSVDRYPPPADLRSPTSPAGGEVENTAASGV
ncbi:MAG: polysaccharide biosynthesis C-terminal domain-containing protein [Gemmataceae bacterium]|nr:polysaccharide biosynthesis C-terminal domain-containing protein [Gemmataceae bacterium]